MCRSSKKHNPKCVKLYTKVTVIDKSFVTLDRNSLTYLNTCSRSKLCKVLLLVSVRSSVVSPLNAPPIRRRPGGESQLTCSDLLCCSWWLVVQPEAVRETQLVRVASEPYPPHATSPSWVWYDLYLGRGGTVQLRGAPEGETTSTDVRPVPSQPPVMRST